MANYYANCRSNYFKVKDNDAFEVAMDEIPGIDVIKTAGENSYCILGDDPDGAGWPSWFDDDNGDEHEIDLPHMVADHLADEEVAIFMESGAEKLRYITGYAVAINNKHETRVVTLNNIYDLAKELTDSPVITVAEY